MCVCDDWEGFKIFSLLHYCLAAITKKALLLTSSTLYNFAIGGINVLLMVCKLWGILSDLNYIVAVKCFCC